MRAAEEIRDFETSPHQELVHCRAVDRFASVTCADHRQFEIAEGKLLVDSSPHQSECLERLREGSKKRTRIFCPVEFHLPIPGSDDSRGRVPRLVMLTPTQPGPGPPGPRAHRENPASESKEALAIGCVGFYWIGNRD